MNTEQFLKELEDDTKREAWEHVTRLAWSERDNVVITTAVWMVGGEGLSKKWITSLRLDGGQRVLTADFDRFYRTIQDAVAGHNDIVRRLFGEDYEVVWGGESTKLRTRTAKDLPHQERQ
jgi:hypothetical protein